MRLLRLLAHSTLDLGICCWLTAGKSRDAVDASMVASLISCGCPTRQFWWGYVPIEPHRIRWWNYWRSLLVRRSPRHRA